MEPYEEGADRSGAWSKLLWEKGGCSCLTVPQDRRGYLGGSRQSSHANLHAVVQRAGPSA